MLVISDMEEYKQLRGHFLAIASKHVNPNILEEIKKYYRPVINSNREYSIITNIEELIRVLEKRGQLHFYNVGSMSHIAQVYFKDTELDDLVSKFQEKIDPQLCDLGTRITLYDPDTVNQVKNLAAATTSSQDVQSEKSDSTSSGQSMGESSTADRIKDLVFLNLCERLGVSWRDFARHLNVQEVEIDKLHKQNPKNLERSSEKILNIYFSRASPNNWKLPLIEALEKIKRPDLKELILQLLYSENI